MCHRSVVDKSQTIREKGKGTHFNMKSPRQRGIGAEGEILEGKPKSLRNENGSTIKKEREIAPNEVRGLKKIDGDIKKKIPNREAGV